MALSRLTLLLLTVLSASVDSALSAEGGSTLAASEPARIALRYAPKNASAYPSAPAQQANPAPTPEPADGAPRDHLKEALERAGCDEECLRDLEEKAKFIGLALVIAIIVLIIRARSTETLSPPGSNNEYHPDGTRRR